MIGECTIFAQPVRLLMELLSCTLENALAKDVDYIKRLPFAASKDLEELIFWSVNGYPRVGENSNGSGNQT